MNIVNEMSSVLTEVESLRAEVKILREGKILGDFEIDQLRRQLVLERERNVALQDKADHRLRRETTLRTMLNEVGRSIVAQVNAFNVEERSTEQPELIGAEAPRYLNGPESNAA